MVENNMATECVENTVCTRPRRSNAIWKHFEIKDESKFQATCNYCLETFSFRSSVTNLKKHVVRKHLFEVARISELSDTEGNSTIKEVHLDQSRDIWEYFRVVDEESKVASCNLCDKKLSYQSTQRFLTKHLNEVHNVEFVNVEMNELEYEHCDSHDDDDDIVVEKIDTDEEDDKGEVMHLSSRVKSLAWDHFTPTDPQNKVATCNLCGSQCSYRSSVSNLMKHARRKHGVQPKRDYDDNSALTAHRRRRSVLWLYYKCVDPVGQVSQCILCRKHISHRNNSSNLRKHLARRHPDASIPGRDDGSKRILLSSGGQLYEVETTDKDGDDDTIQNDEDMDAVYLEDFDSLESPETKPKIIKTNNTRKRLRAHNDYDTSSDEEVTFRNKYVKTKSDSIDYFSKYLASLLKQLPKELSNQLQTDFIKQIMNAQASDARKTVTSTENGYISTVFGNSDESEYKPPSDDTNYSITVGSAQSEQNLEVMVVENASDK